MLDHIKNKCSPDDVALKTFFLGPQAENGQWLLGVVTDLLNHWFKWRKDLFPEDGEAISTQDQMTPEYLFRRKAFENSLAQLIHSFENEIPHFSPRYMGHMYSEISLPALLGHFVTLLHNPNNISSESSRIGVKYEDQAVQSLIKMVGYETTSSRGHFTSGGTLANFESLVRANLRIKKWLSLNNQNKMSLFEAAHRGWDDYDQVSTTSAKIEETNPYHLAEAYSRYYHTSYLGPVLLVSDSRHYSWDKGLSLLNLGKDALWGVQLNNRGRMCLTDLNKKIEKASQENRPILMITSVAGSTELGSIDEIHLINDLLKKWQKRGIHLWHHVDAAYGGFFKTLPQVPQFLSSFSYDSLGAIGQTNSVTLDPHKLGYVPYASGTFLCKSSREYTLNTTAAPYINYQLNKDRGPVTLEGSRSAGGAVATWMTSQCVGFDPEGYGLILGRIIKSARKLETLLENADTKIKILPSDTNIICFCVAKTHESVSETNKRTLDIFEKFSPSKNNLHIVSKTSLHWDRYATLLNEFIHSWSAQKDADSLHVIRLCLMNPFHDSKELKRDMSESFVSKLCDIITNSA